MTKRHRYIVASCLAYGGFAAAWIFFSDGLLLGIADAQTMVRLSTAKGLAFVVVTAALLFVVLAKAPSAGAAPVRPPAATTRPWSLLIALAAMIAVIAAVGAVAYRAQITSIERAEVERLQAVARLKVGGVRRWMDERRANVRSLAQSAAARDDLKDWLATRDDAGRQRLLGVMRSLMAHYGFSGINVYDAAGKLLFGAGEIVAVPGRDDIAALQTAQSPVFYDLRRKAPGEVIHMGFLAPVHDGDRQDRALLGVFAFEMRPETFLYPFIRNWPLPSETGETVLARPEGDGLVVLNDIRNGRDTALNLRLPVGKATLPAAPATGVGAVLGTDHRGVAVLAAMQRVPGTSWTLIAKVDQDEALAAFKRAAFGTGTMVAAALLVAAILVAFLWQRRRLHAALTEISLHDYLTKVAKALPGTLLSFRMRPDGAMSMPYASPNLRELTGLDPAEVADDAAATFAQVHPDDLAGFQAKIFESAQAMELLRREFRIRHPVKGEVWIETRALPEREADGGILWHGFAHDVTERKHDEEKLRLAATVLASTHEGVVVTDRDTRIVAINPAYSAITGYSEGEAIGQTPRLLKSGRHDRDFYRTMWHSISIAGYWQGEIWNRRKSGHIYPEWLTISAVRDKTGEVVNYVATFTDISRIKQSESQLEHLAHHDPLTELPNRLLLRSRLAHSLTRARRSGHQGALLLLDLDRFKNINESRGHVVGDSLLIQAARRLRAHVREVDTVARPGADEFLVLVDEVETRAQAADLATKLMAELAKPFALGDGQDIYVGASIGISIFPEDGETADLAIQHAESALNQAKAGGGGGNYRFYSSLLTDAANARFELEGNLRRALDHDEFILHYQPMVAAADRRVTGVEALIRWRSVGKGLVLPGLFIPVAEETGMIVPLGEWVLRTACRQMKAWRDAGLPLDLMAVNLSPVQFNDAALIDRLRDILDEAGLPAHCLELEITEGTLIETGGDVEAKLARLKALGVRLAIDDFGTGYSSLAYLKRFPIDKLKIDRCFVKDLPDDGADAKITNAIISIGKSLNLEVLAEGVETEQQMAFLRTHGCDTMQGYLFGRPMPADEVAALMDARRLLSA